MKFYVKGLDFVIYNENINVGFSSKRSFELDHRILPHFPVEPSDPGKVTLGKQITHIETPYEIEAEMVDFKTKSLKLFGYCDSGGFILIVIHPDRKNRARVIASRPDVSFDVPKNNLKTVLPILKYLKIKWSIRNGKLVFNL